MSKNIEIKGNYIYITDSVSLVVFDRSAALVEFRKKDNTSELFTVWYKGYAVGIDNCIWSDFLLEGVPFASQVAFEDWKNANTASLCSGGGGGGVVEPSAFPFVIGSGDWTPGGEEVGSTHYFVVTHGLGTTALLQPSIWETLLGKRFIRQVNGFFSTGLGITDSLNQVRIEVSAVYDVDGVVSSGGNAVVTDTLTYNSAGEIINNAAPSGDTGLNTPVNKATDVTLTINTNICGVGKIAFYTQKAAGRILCGSGSLNLLPFSGGSHISGGLNATIGIYNIDGVDAKVIGETQ